MKKTMTYHLTITVVVGGCLISLLLLALWSLSQTIVFTSFAFVESHWGIIAGFFIQFAPQVFLVLASVSVKPGTRLFWYLLFGTFSVLDMSTNIGAMAQNSVLRQRIEDNVNLPAWAKQMAIIFGYTVALFIVFAEELIAILVATFFHSMSEVWKELGHTPPRWMTMSDFEALRALGTGNPSRPRQRKQQQRDMGRRTIQPTSNVPQVQPRQQGRQRNDRRQQN